MSAVVAAGLALAGADSAGAESQPWPPDRLSPHIAVQNTWFTDADIRRYGFRNGVISISGHWLLQQGTFGGSFADFVAKTRRQVRRRLGDFMAAHPEVDRHTSAIVLLDIEKPHPANLHARSARQREAIVAAYKVRIEAARAAFPNARLALYGTLNPDPRGRRGDRTYLARLRALIEAGDEGLYDELAYLVPVLYVRFGCADARLGPCDRYWATLDDYTRLGVDGSSRLRRSDGSTLPLLPIFGFRVYNGNSRFHRELLLNLRVPEPVGATLRTQVEILVQSGVRQFALWTGMDSNELGGPTDPTVTDHLRALVRQRSGLLAAWPRARP